MMNKMLNWISGKKIIGIFFVIICILLITYLFFFYRYIENSKIVNADELSAFILNETNITEINEMYHFAGDKTYDIVYGHDDKNKKWILFNPENNNNENELIRYPLEELLSQEQIEQSWQKECEGCTLKKSNPAIINNNPLWELTYMDQNEGYVMEYISLKDGSTYEKLRLYPKYNTKG